MNKAKKTAMELKDTGRKIKHNNRGGTALFIVMSIMSGFLLITLTASDIIKNGLVMVKTQMESTKAYFAAEAGAERILWLIRKKAGFPDPGDGSTGFCEATTAKFCFDSSSEIVSCIAYGSSCPVPLADSQLLSNGAMYKLKFEYNTGTTTLSSYGSILDDNRVIKVSY